MATIPRGILAAMKLLVAVVLLTVACGSKPPTTTTPKADEEAVVVLPDVPFDKLDHDQRIAFMKQKVVPVMKPLYQKHDAKDFAEFGCKTCHGDDVKDGHFDMPNPKLPKLNFKDHNSKYKKEDLEWMGKEIMPTMGKILDLPLYSEANPKGFGCLACHTLEGP
jgi:cytochrome c553